MMRRSLQFAGPRLIVSPVLAVLLWAPMSSLEAFSPGAQSNLAAPQTQAPPSKGQSPPGPGGPNQGGPRAVPAQPLPSNRAPGAPTLSAPARATHKPYESTSDLIRHLEYRWVEASRAGDSRLIEKYLSDDYAGVRADGKLVTKEDFLQNQQSGQIKLEAPDLQDFTVHVYEDTAVVTGRASGTAGPYRYTRVWVKVNGEWKIAASQATRISE